VSKKLRKEAEALTDSLSTLSDVAFERTLAFIMEELKSDKNLTNTLAPLIRDGTLSQMISMERHGKGKEMEKVKRLPPSCKRFKHLRDNLIKHILQCLEPKLEDSFFENCPLEPLLLLTLGLNVKGDGELPRAWFPQCTLIPELIKICQHRYKDMGSRLAGVASLSSEDAKAFGYYKVHENTMTCPILFEGVTVELPDHKGEYLIHGNGEHDAKLRMPKLKCTVDIKELFEEMGCKFPSEDERWEWPGVLPAPKEDAGSSSASSAHSAALTTPKKPPQSSKGSPANSLSEALMARLHGNGSVSAKAPGTM